MVVEVLTLSSFVVAMVALVISFISLQTAERGARNDLLAQVRVWGDNVINILSDASSLCAWDHDTLATCEFSVRRSDLMSCVSSIWDRGRLFFPNIVPEYQDTTSAYQGIRPPILDLLALSYELTRRIDRSSEKNSRRGLALIRLRREFVSVIQKATAFSSPPKVRKYEEYLTKIKVSPLPLEIQELADAESRGFELEFDKNLDLKDDYAQRQAQPASDFPTT